MGLELDTAFHDSVPRLSPSAMLDSWVEETWTGLCIENKEKIRSCLQGIHKYYTSSSGKTMSEEEKFV